MTHLLLALTLAAVPAVPAVPAADSGGGLRWSAALGYGFEAFTRDRSTWHAATAQLGHRFERGTLIGEVLAARRYGVTDEAVAVDAYRTLWHGAYGNLRTQAAPGAEVLPRLDVSAELFQAVRSGLEFSAGYRRMQFQGDHADIWTGGLGLYLPGWYLRARSTVVPRAGAIAVSGSFSARRYFRTSDDYLDVQAGIGEELLTVGTGPAGPLVEVRRNRFAAAIYRRFVTPRLGFAIGATYTGTDGLPDRRGLTVGLTRRW